MEKHHNPLPTYDHNLLITGCDEVGRGCLAGPVVAAAVILPLQHYYFLLKDSKKLTAKQRVEMAAIIKEEAMHRAINKLIVKPELLFIDGNQFLPYPNINHECIIKGDERCNSIAAASIIAKVYRDEYMQELSEHEPGYNWEINMGYPTKEHYQAVYELGMSFHHRRSFSMVAKHLQPRLWAS